jgi:hypothetical protein
MADVRLQIPDTFISDVNKSLGSDAKATDIARDALTLYNWAVKERANGRVILSSTDKGEDLARLAMPSLDLVNRQS